MHVDQIKLLYNYNYWANARILQAAAGVSNVQFTAPSRLSHGGLRGTLVHTLGAEWIWRKRCHEGVSPTALPAVDEFATLADLQARWQTEETAMRSFLESLNDSDLTGVVKYRSTSGRPQEHVLWQILVHLVNHGTQTRSEAAVLLTEYGHSPGDLELILYLRQQN